MVVGLLYVGLCWVLPFWIVFRPRKRAEDEHKEVEADES